MDDFTTMIMASLQSDIKVILSNIADKVVEELKRNVETDLYNSYAPNYYNRTMDFLDKITKTSIISNGSGFEVTVFFDTANMSQSPGVSGQLFGTRTSFDGSTSYGGQSISDWLVMWYEDLGTSGVNSPYDIKPIHMIRKTKDWLNANLDGIVRSEFAKLGITISVG